MKNLIIFFVFFINIFAENIAVVGSGYVGLVTGVCFAEGGHRVTCIDINQERIDNLNKGIIPIFEAGLEEIFLRNLYKNIFFTTDSSQAILDNDYIFLAVNTPSNIDGSCNLEYLKNAFNQIIRVVEKQNKHKIVCTKSTVAIGTNSELQKIADSSVNGLIKVVSNPEFLREGFAVQDCFAPSRIVVGGVDAQICKRVADLYSFLNVPAEKIVITDLSTAELIKYASNSFLALKLVFINEIANYCNKMGASVEGVALGMGLDERIGNLFLKAGPGISGSCFPKDVKALDYSLSLKDIKGIINSISAADSLHKKNIVSVCKQYLAGKQNPTIALLGLTFKAGTDDLRDSISLLLIEEFKDIATIKAYDPKGISNAKMLYPELSYYSSPMEACIDADLIIVATEWPQVAELEISKLSKIVKNKNIVDLRNLFSVPELKKYDFDYFNLGRTS